MSDAVPELYDPRNSVEAEDLTIGRMKVATFTSPAVQNEEVPVGCIFVTEDDEPEEVSDGQEGLRVYALAMKKGWSWTQGEDDDLQTVWDGEAGVVPPEAKRVYDFLLAVPSLGALRPVKMLFKGSGLSAARRIITTVVESEKPFHETPFVLTTKKASSDQYKWYKPVAKKADIDAETAEADQALVAKLVGFASSFSAPRRAAAGELTASTDEPAI